jgi:hypothetical protein
MESMSCKYSDGGVQCSTLLRVSREDHLWNLLHVPDYYLHHNEQRLRKSLDAKIKHTDKIIYDNMLQSILR